MSKEAKQRPRYLVERPVIDPIVHGEKRPDEAVHAYLEQKHADGYDLVSVSEGRYIFRAV